MCAEGTNFCGTGAYDNNHGGDGREGRDGGGEYGGQVVSGSEDGSEGGSEGEESEEENDVEIDDDEEFVDRPGGDVMMDMGDEMADVVEGRGVVVGMDEEMEIILSTEECRKGRSKTYGTAPAKSSEAESAEVEGDKMVGDEAERDGVMGDGKDGSRGAPQPELGHEMTLTSTRPPRTIRPPDRLHQNANVFYDFQDDSGLLSDYDDSETDDGDVPWHTHVLKHMPAERDAKSDSEYTLDQKNLGKEKRRHEEEGWKNGKMIKPELDGWAQIAAPNYYVYLQRSVPTGHWYIGYTSKPWTRLLEHNGTIGNGHNLGEYTQDESKRPWKIMLLVEGFENNIAAQSFEQTWARRNPNLQEDRSSGVGHFLQTLIQVLHKQTSARHLLDLRFFDRKSLNSWRRQVSGGYYRQAPLKIIDNVHEDVPGWDQDKTTEQFKNHPLQVMKREVRDYSLHHEHLARGRRLITESNVKHTCTICHKVIGDEDGKGEAIFEHRIEGPVTATPLMVLCPSTGCTAVSHATCLAYQHFQDEKNAGNPNDYEHITLPVPISGNCRTCGRVGDWKDYRREIIARLKASHEFWRKVWRREAVNHKARRLAERRMNEAERGLNVLLLKTASPTARPAICQVGIRQAIFTGSKEVTLAIQNAICGQVVTGDIHRLGWYEKILLGDHICIERIHEWLNSHIDNHKHMMFLPVQDDIFINHVSLADIKNFLGASAVYWAHWQNSRADERSTTQTTLSVVDDKDAWRRRTGPGKGVFKENDTYWMWEDDMEKRTALGGAWLDAVALRGTNAGPAVAAEMALLAEAARERATRLLEDVEFREVDKPRRRKEDEKERERQNAIRVLKVGQRESQRLLNSAKPPPGIVEQLRQQREEMQKLRTGSRLRQVEMTRRKGVAKVRNKWRERDNANAIRRRRIRHLIERKMRYTLAGTPTAGPAKRRLGPRRNKAKTRVRYVDDPVKQTDSRTRSGFSLVPEAGSSEDQDMYDADDDSDSSSDSSGSEDENPGLSSNGSRTSSDGDSDDGSDGEHDLTLISAEDLDTNSKNQEQLRLMALFMERAGYHIGQAEPTPTIESHEQPDTPPASRLSSAEIERNSPRRTPKRKRTPKQPSPAKRAWLARRAALLATPPHTPRRRARPGYIPPYVSPTHISTPGRADDLARIGAAMRQHREAYDDRYFPLEVVKRGRSCFEGRHVLL